MCSSLYIQPMLRHGSDIPLQKYLQHISCRPINHLRWYFQLLSKLFVLNPASISEKGNLQLDVLNGTISICIFINIFNNQITTRYRKTRQTVYPQM